MSNRKSLEKSMEDIDEEEEEHAKLMKTQDEYEKQSMHEMPKLDDQEYARMIEISESHGLGDVNMEDFQINDDDNEEEKLPLKMMYFQENLSLQIMMKRRIRARIVVKNHLVKKDQLLIVNLVLIRIKN